MTTLSPTKTPTAAIRLDRLRLGELIMLVASIALVVDVVAFPWYSVRAAYASGAGAAGVIQVRNYSPGAVFHILTPLAIICVMLAWAICVVQVIQRGPALPVAMTCIATILDAILVLGLFIRVVLDQPSITFLGTGTNEIKPDVASVTGLCFAVLLLFGAWRALRTDGLAAADNPQRIETLRLAPRAR